MMSERDMFTNSVIFHLGFINARKLNVLDLDSSATEHFFFLQMILNIFLIVKKLDKSLFLSQKARELSV